MKSHYSIQAGHFKAKCLQLMDEVHDKHVTITITKHGKPVAKLIPIDETPVELFGCLKNTITVNQDLLMPIDTIWEANK